MHYSHALGARRHRAHGMQSCLGHGWNRVSSSSTAWAQRDRVCHSGDLWGERTGKKHRGALGEQWESNGGALGKHWESNGRTVGEHWRSTEKHWGALGEQ